MTIADSQGIDYDTGMEGMENERATSVDRTINTIMRERNLPKEDAPTEEQRADVEVEETPQPPMGLMARRL